MVDTKSYFSLTQFVLWCRNWADDVTTVNSRDVFSATWGRSFIPSIPHPTLGEFLSILYQKPIARGSDFSTANVQNVLEWLLI